MLTIAGIIVVGAILALILTGRTSPVAAFILIPVIAAALIGESLADIGKQAGEGMTAVSTTALLFLFAIVFFGIMRTRGIFDPLVSGVLRLTKEDPLWVCVATVIVASCVHFDGIGAATFLITIPAFLGVYDRLGMSRLVLACLTGLSAGVMNTVPWGGTTARAASALGLDPVELWKELIPIQFLGIVLILGLAVYFGLRQRKLAQPAASDASESVHDEQAETGAGGGQADVVLTIRQPLYWINVALIIAAIGTLLADVLEPHIVFAIALGLALVINYATAAQQMERMVDHAREAMPMVLILVAAGVFLGIISGTGMLDAIGDSLVAITPAAAHSWLHIAIGVLGVPVGMVFGPDPYYFGIVPIVNEVATQAGVAPVDVAKAMLIADNVGFTVSPAVPSAFLLAGLAKVSFIRHVRFTFGWALALGAVLVLAALATGVIARP